MAVTALQNMRLLFTEKFLTASLIFYYGSFVLQLFALFFIFRYIKQSLRYNHVCSSLCKSKLYFRWKFVAVMLSDRF